MIVEIISIGTELILGDVVDTNAAYIAQNLTANGFNINYMTTVGDNKVRMVKTMKQALHRADLIITTGGLGPTDDDLTREAIAESTASPLEEKPELLNNLTNYFHHRNYHMTDNNKKQAYLPKGATAINNELGTAPGILLQKDNYLIISLPGVPREMKHIFQQELIPYLKTLNKAVIKSKILNFFSIGESSLETRLKEVLNQQTNPTLALLAGTGEVKIRITAKAESDQEAEMLIEQAEGEIRKKVGKYIYSSNDLDLSYVVGKLLTEKNMTLAVAESCTGGLISNRITDVPGSSNYFKGGMITYSNQAKNKQLAVKQTTLDQYGAVSTETVSEMAEGVREKMKTDLGLAVSGIAGPGGGSEEKPVGLVYIALANGEKTETYQLNLHKDRIWNKWMSSQYGLYYLYQYLTIY